MPCVQAGSFKRDTKDGQIHVVHVQVQIVPPSVPFPRLKDDWVVGYIKGGLTTELKASVGAVPNQPPSTSWNFFNYDTHKREVDESLSCSSIFVSSPPCCLTISLSGAAKEFQGKCEGEYKSTGLVSMGREVIII